MDPGQRDKIIQAMQSKSAGDLVLFFAAFGLAEAFEGPAEGWGKAKRIGAALIAARKEGTEHAVLAAAATRFLPATAKREPRLPSIQMANPRGRVRAQQLTFVPRVSDAPKPDAASSLVFISHVANEYEMARLLKDAIESAFSGRARVFVSSDPESIALGEKWLERITTSLKDSVVQVIVASPGSVLRQWITFEAGAGWIREIPVIPLCHSGMTPASLPLPLNMLQAAPIGTADGLRKAFLSIATALGLPPPKFKYSALASRLRRIEARFARDGTSIVQLPMAAPNRRSGPQLRGLSADRLKMESELNARILQLQSLRARGNRAEDPRGLSDAAALMSGFWSAPDRYSDEEVVDASGLLDRVIAEMQEAGVPNLRKEILKRLKEMERQQASRSEILTLDLDAIATDIGVAREVVQGDLAELIREGLVEGYLETLGQSRFEGACRITGKGLEYLRNLS